MNTRSKSQSTDSANKEKNIADDATHRTTSVASPVSITTPKQAKHSDTYTDDTGKTKMAELQKQFTAMKTLISANDSQIN